MRRVAVIGGGLMGHGIALTFARQGHPVRVFDPDAATRNGFLSRVATSLSGMGAEPLEPEAFSLHDNIPDAVVDADIVFEAAPEKPELKQAIFAEVEAKAPAEALFASNTSVIPITKIMGGLKTKHRAMGTHWWNPPHMIPLVEVIKTEWTDATLAEDMHALLASVGKTPVMVEKDVAGFIGNRLQHAMWREAISLVENGICDAAAVDTVVKASFGRRLSVLGPLENADLVGTDLTLDIHENVLFDLENRAGPSPHLRALVEDGKLGMKSGEGFQKWSQAEADEVRARVARHLKRLDAILDD